ncbi:oncostatin-M [Apus apus]|uniref:oncostatin-M n=1 Tax=Apus apus TaxID=8895 RepID=UPI0021F8B2D7|nr:oncostatin-M [Apus apus]
MRHDGRLPGVLVAVTKGLLILWAVPGQGGRPPTLQQIQALVRHMAEDAQELFTFYEKNQGLAINHLCRNNHPPEWLRGPETVPRGLQELRGLRGTMVRMAQALQDITRHQRDLNPPGAEILRRLASTHLKVRGLLNNLDVLYPTPSPRPGRQPPPSPAAPAKVFQKKLEGCQILWSFSRLMAKLSSQLEGKNRRARRDRQRGRRGSRLPRRS